MAEFKLGRIRFVWKDEWQASVTYYKDDVVRYGGKTFICVVGHTSADSFYTDLDYSPTKWNQLTDGTSWKGDWNTDTLYIDGDVVKYGGLLYICDESHTSAATTALGLEANQANWDLYLEGIDWKSDWSVATRYKLNDVVKYGGVTYICNTYHTSAADANDGLELDQDKWTVYNSGIEYKGDWSNPVRYKVNDVVKYGSGLFICVDDHSSTGDFSTDVSTYWEEFVKGFEFESEWNVATEYQVGDVVVYGGNQYISKTIHTGETPSTSTANWDLFTEGFNFQSDWSIQTSYRPGDFVRVNGYTYLAKVDSASFNLTVTATSSSDNSLTVGDTTGLVAGMAIRFDAPTYGDIAPNATYYIKQVINGTKISITGQPDSTVHSVTDSSTAMQAYAAAMPPNTSYWERLTTGVVWQGEWQDDVEYMIGDAIRFGSNAYICIQTHRSDQDDGSSIVEGGGGADNSRPDQDVNGVYWNLLSIGTETAVLTTRGDLVYYGGAGPTRLPVGREGQILRAGAEDPEWVTLGEIDHVYYVAPTGTDLPAPVHGKTLDKPWKTIRYAAMQVEQGPRNPNAKRLLELNRAFIQREVTEYILWRIANAGVGELFENFEYEDFKCERDIGWMVDALRYDISHGGNVKTRGHANALVGGITEDSPGAYPNLSVESEESIAAYNYMATVVNNVLNQEAPAVNYQVTNGDNSTAIVEQYFEPAIDAETEAYTEITNLVTIVTNALEDGDTSRIPARFTPSNLIKVATGRYREVLPIIVPERTCILGDELRSTNAGPGTGTTSRSDIPYSVKSLGRVEEIIGDIITGSEVTATTGNTEAQSREFPFADTPEVDVTQQLVRTMQHSIDYRTSAISLVNSRDPVGYNYTFLEGFGDARTLVLENKEFLKAEVMAYLADSYSSLKYSRTICKRDVGYIVDAIIYDLTYGGSMQSTYAGLAYYDGSSGALQIDSTEKTATLAAYGYLRTIMQDVATNVAVTALQTDIAQVRGTAGSAAAETAIADNLSLIIDIITNSRDAATTINRNITAISSNVITFDSNHGLQVGDKITPKETGNGLIKNKDYYIISAPAANTATVSTSFGGSTATLTNGSGLSILTELLDQPTVSAGVTSKSALITAAETLSAAKQTIIENVIDDLNAEAWHTDFIVRSTNLTNDDFEIYVGKNDIVHTYVSGGIVTFADDSSLDITNFVYNESTGVATVTVESDHGLEAGDIVDITNILVECTHPGASPITQTTVYPSATGTRSGTTKVRYVQNKCIRDIGIIIDGVSFDFMFDSNHQSYKNGHSYLRASASEVYTLNQKTVTRNALANAKTEAKANVGGDTTAQARIETLMTLVDDIIFSGSNEGDNCATGIRNRDHAVLQIEKNRDFIVSEVTAWMNYNYVNFDDYYTSATCARDVGYIIDAVSYDLITGSNFASSVAGAAYYRNVTSAQNVINSQLTQTLAAFRYTRELVLAETNSSLWQDIIDSFEIILNIIEFGTDEIPTYLFPDNGTTTGDDSTTASTFQTNRASYISDVSTYLSTNYSAQWTALGAQGQATCQRDLGYIIDAQTFDVAYGGNYQTVIAGDSYYSYGLLQIGAGAEKTATLAAIAELKSLLVADAEAGSQTSVGNNMDDITDIINNGAGTVSTVYPSETGETATIQSTFTDIQAAKSATQTAVTTYITDTFSSYTYNTALCERDVNEFINALKYDVKYPGNYKSLLASRYYANAVTGSLEEDMFYLRDATGVRDMTLEGLTGDLLAPNAYGTSRVSAGAYASLDPGWGPDDYRAWIIDRSPYVQGVTTLGTACIGQKIDGALHNGGNDSIVSNDFTQVLSDGIGAWIANNGRAELVSVFTYYCHIGYLATEGGRIRGTNGNCSYGDFGAVAEGFDSTETPNTAIVDNQKQFEATVQEVQVDGDELLTFMYLNAGIDYTEVNWTVTGGGQGHVLEHDEFRDDGVYEVRLLDLGDDSSGQFGGDGYLTNSNTAQAGTTTQITLAATDGELSTAYIGMKVVLTGGQGAGQYGIVDTYNAGTKVATIVKESDGTAGWDHFVPGRTILAPNASTTYDVEPAISFAQPTTSAELGSITSGSWFDTVYGETTAVYTGVSGAYDGAGINASFDVVRNGWKYIVSINEGGEAYERLETITIPGTSLGGSTPANDITITITSVNSATGAITQFDQEGFGAGGVYVATSATGGIEYSLNGTDWTATTIPSAGGNGYKLGYGLIDDGTSDLKVGRFVAVADGTAQAAYSDDGITWVASTLPASGNWKSPAFGDGRFVSVNSNNTTVAISLDGQEWDITGTLNSTGFASVDYGQGLFVAVKSGSTGAAEWSDDGGETWTAVDMPANSTWGSVAYGMNTWVAVASDSNDGAVSTDGKTWTDMTIGSPDSNDPAGYQQVSYGQGLFMATATLNGQTGYNYAVKSENGLYWEDVGLPSSSNHDGFNALAFGNPQRTGYWVVFPNDAGTEVVRVKTGARARGRAFVAEEKIFQILITEPGSGYDEAPTMTITDPNNVYELPHQVRVGSGVLGNPSYVSRGSQFETGGAEVDAGDGFADFFQNGTVVAVRRITQRPIPGSNVVFDHLPDRTFKLVNVITFLGTDDGSYTAFFQVSPELSISEAPPQGTGVTTRLRYSQTRLTGHDFLDVGTGNFTETNYPGLPLQDPVPSNETVQNNGGRVFYTSTDQDGNFRVGDLFSIEQSTGVATLNADAFNISGLQELNLGNVTLGGGSATVTEFSTDPFFTADSDNIVPTQRAIKAYIAAQIGGGGASLNVNSVTAGSIFISSNRITHVDGGSINMDAVFEFRGGVLGLPVAFNYFLR